MLNKRKEFKMTILQIIILNTIATVISVGGLIAFSILSISNNGISAIISTILLVLSIWDLIFAISVPLGILLTWIITKKEVRNKISDILKEEYNSQSYTFQTGIVPVIISIIIILLVIVLLSI